MDKENIVFTNNQENIVFTNDEKNIILLLYIKGADRLQFEAPLHRGNFVQVVQYAQLSNCY